MSQLGAQVLALKEPMSMERLLQALQLQALLPVLLA